MMFATINILTALLVVAVSVDAARRLSFRCHPVATSGHVVMAIAEMVCIYQIADLRSVPAWVAVINLVLSYMAMSSYLHIERTGRFGCK